MSELLQITTPTYTLREAADRPYLYLETPAGGRLLELFVPGSVHSTQGLDDTTSLGDWRSRDAGNETVLERDATSSVWRRKTYRVRCTKERLRFETEVEGDGDVTDMHLFGGYCSANIRWGSGYFWSGTRLGRGFNPEPTVDERPYFLPGEGSLIDATGVPLPGKASWFFTPPPYCFAFEGADMWFGMGIEASSGEHRYTDFRYVGQYGAFALTLAFDGRTRISGRHRLPALGIDFGAGPYDVLERHVRGLRERDEAPRVVPAERPRWWSTPIYCGWGSQCHLAVTNGGPAPLYARQENYERFLAALERNGVSPGVVVLDDKWQAHYGTNEVDLEKWPDLPAFVRAQHTAGRKVLLWLKAWDPEGLPQDECVLNAAGRVVAFDPTNPMFERRLRESVRHMLGPDGLDADGFKLDFSARMPSGPGLRLHGDVWGLELMKRYLAILYEEAKRAKSDALLMTHTPHPYLADALDMIRLNDINTGRDIQAAMTHRARVARIACPEAIIDTDNWPITDREAWRAYTRLQPELGVPSLYYATHIDATREPLEPSDYALLRDTWDRHRAKLGRRGGGA